MKQVRVGKARKKGGNMKRWRAMCAMILFFWSSLFVGAEASGVMVVEPNEEELLLCSLNLNRLFLSDQLEVYVKPQGLFLPMGTICGLLEFGLEVDPTQGSASGYLWDEEHPFSLDMASQSIMVAGKQLSYDASHVEAHPDDIYVEVSQLSAWLGLAIAADRYIAAVAVQPTTKLPIQLRLEREQRGTAKATRYGITERSYYPRSVNPYHFLDGCNLDFSVNSSLSSYGSGGNATIGGPYYSALLTGDLLWMSGSLAVTGKLDGPDFTPTSLYGLLRRTDPDGELFGPLGATAFSIGKVSAVLPSLSGASASGYGAMISSYALTSSSYFDLQTLTGPLLSGWDVELYRNESYLDYRKADESGIYAFADIPLVFGTNVLRLEFHGPLGQKKTEEHVYTVGSNMVKPGTFSYRASATAGDEGGQYAFQTTYGLSQALTLNASALSGAFSDGRNLHAQAGVAGYFSRLQFDASAGYDARHTGFAGDLGLRTQLLGLGFSWRGTYLDRNWAWANDSYSTPSYLARSVLRADGLKWKLQKLYSTLSSSWTSTWYRNSDWYNILTLRQYNSYRNFYLNNVVNLHHYWYGESSSYLFYAEGSSAARLSLGRIYLGASCDYDVYPELLFNSLSCSAEAGLPLSIQGSATVSYSFLYDVASASVSLYREVNPVKVGLTGAWSSLKAFSIGLSVSTSIALDARYGAVAASSRSSAGQGSIVARTFIDTNYNGKWDKGEKPLKGVGFIVNDNGGAVVTNAEGEAFLRGLSANVPVNVEIDKTSLEDLLLVPASKGVSCVLHPGTAARLDFPLWITREITGTVWSVEGDLRRSLAGATLELLDASGAVVGSVRSAYDGYYSFSAVKVGEYTLRLIRKIADGTVKYMSRIVLIPAEGGYVDGVDLEYRPTNGTP